jgi:hypothetical protein
MPLVLDFAGNPTRGDNESSKRLVKEQGVDGILHPFICSLPFLRLTATEC